MYKARLSSGKEYSIEFSDKEKTKGTINGKEFSLDLVEERANRFHVISEGLSYTIEFTGADETGKFLDMVINGNKSKVQITDKYDALLSSLGMDNLLTTKVNEIKAPMPGLVLDIKVEEGMEVKKGDSVIVLEAMKMENNLKSPTDGKVKSIHVKKGVAVEKNQVLIRFE